MSEVRSTATGPSGKWTTEAAIEHIVAFLQPGPRPAFLLIAVAPSSRERELSHAILERFPSDLPVHEFRFAPDSFDAVDVLHDPMTSQPGLVWLFGLSELDDDVRKAALENLNLARETLRRSKHSFLCFCDPEDVAEFARRAGDVYAAMNFLVTLDLPRDRNLVPPAVISLPLGEAQLLRRRAELYRRHLDTPWVETESRGQALVDLAEVLRRLGREKEARQARDEGLRILAAREAHAKLLDVYLQNLLAETETVRLSDLAVQAGHHILSVPLDKIFVPLGMVEETSKRVPDVPGAEEPTTDQEASAAVAKRELRRHQAIDTRPLSLQELFEVPRAVILGDPGSGKSTLLRYIARLLARCALGKPQPEGVPPLPDGLRGLVPMLVPVGQLPRRLTRDGRPDLEGFIRDGLSKLPGVGATLIRCLEDGEAFLLVDGLDEVPAALRVPTRDAIEAYLSSHPRTRCTATSRVVGYESARLGTDFAHVRLQDLDDEAIREFGRRWYEAIRGIGGIDEEPKALADRLWEAISASPGTRRIAGNPLLLTIIGLVHYRGSRLPEKRLEVYEAATKTLLENWLARRPFTTLHSGELLLVLPRIAFEIHSEVRTGLVPYEWLKERFSAYLADVRMPDKTELTSEVDSLLKTLSQHSGLLLERGLSVEGEPLFGFLHLTFQEYLAALWLFERWTAFAMPVRRARTRRAKDSGNPIYPVVFRPRWQEVILLAAGRASDTSQAAATRFLQDVVEFQDRYEPIVNRTVLAAGRMLGEGLRVDRDLAARVCEKLGTLYFKNSGALRNATIDVFGHLGRSEYGAWIREPLLARLADEDSDVRQAAAQALGALREPRAVEPLLARLADKEPFVREAAAEALGALREPRAVEPLLARLADKEPFVREAAAGALGNIGGEMVVKRLDEIFFPAGAKRPRLTQKGGKGAIDLMAAREALFLALMNLEGRGN